MASLSRTAGAGSPAPQGVATGSTGLHPRPCSARCVRYGAAARKREAAPPSRPTTGAAARRRFDSDERWCFVASTMRHGAPKIRPGRRSDTPQRSSAPRATEHGRCPTAAGARERGWGARGRLGAGKDQEAREQRRDGCPARDGALAEARATRAEADRGRSARGPAEAAGGAPRAPRPAKERRARSLR